MKINRKEKTVQTFKITMSEKEMLGLFNEIYDHVDISALPTMRALFRALTDKVHDS